MPPGQSFADFAGSDPLKRSSENRQHHGGVHATRDRSRSTACEARVPTRSRHPGRWLLREAELGRVGDVVAEVELERLARVRVRLRRFPDEPVPPAAEVPQARSPGRALLGEILGQPRSQPTVTARSVTPARSLTGPSLSKTLNLRGIAWPAVTTLAPCASTGGRKPS